MFFKISIYGEILALGEINGVFIPYTGESCNQGDRDITIKLPGFGPVHAIDLQGNLYLPANTGSVDYYSGYGAHREGKIRYIGSTEVDYYSGYGAHREGKVRQAGNRSVDYYSGYGAHREGKIRSIE